jgi:hypothetical protein
LCVSSTKEWSVKAILGVAAVAAAGLLTLGFAPAAQASNLPPDCSLAAAGSDGLSLTCANRPADQQWHLGLYCTYWTRPSLVPGNVVTGNGTSTAHCLFGYEPDGGIFVVNQ